MAVNEFDHPFVAATYDQVEGSREDLDQYAGIAEELGARSVLDIGAGTGTLAVRLAADGLAVTAVEPAARMLEVARTKPHAEKVHWIHGTAPDLAQHSPAAPLPADLAVMTANVAQVFLTDEDWLATLRAVRDSLAPGGHLVFETRIPERRAWEDWARQPKSTWEVPGVGTVREVFEVTEVELPLVSFRSDSHLPDGTVVPFASTLTFRSLEQIQQTLVEAGFEFLEARDAPDRPGREWVVLARCLAPAGGEG